MIVLFVLIINCCFFYQVIRDAFDYKYLIKSLRWNPEHLWKTEFGKTKTEFEGKK